MANERRTGQADNIVYYLRNSADSQFVVATDCAKLRRSNVEPVNRMRIFTLFFRLGLEKHERKMETARFAGGPTIKLYGRPLGADVQIMQRIQHMSVDDKDPASCKSKEI